MIINKLRWLTTMVCVGLFATSLGGVASAQTDDEKAATTQPTQQGNLWGKTNSSVHLAGYATVGYTQKTESTGNEAMGVSFSPIFHYQYKDLALMEGELEIELNEKGETETKLEYGTIDIFLNDYMILVAGAFLSPIGYFRQNIHPSWINKLPSAPIGFGHDGAAPASDVGLQLRGGIPFGGMRINYALYGSNGPTLTEESDHLGELALKQEAFGEKDADNGKTGGGRLGFLLMDDLEIGVSGAGGQVRAVNLTSAGDPGGPRDFQVVGADLGYNSSLIRGLWLRGEFVQTTVGEVADTSFAYEELKLQAWYAQLSYRIEALNLEPVARYGSFVKEAGHHKETTTQITGGLNYLFAPSIIAKVAFQQTKPEEGEADNEVLFQLAYGF